MHEDPIPVPEDDLRLFHKPVIYVYTMLNHAGLVLSRHAQEVLMSSNCSLQILPQAMDDKHRQSKLLFRPCHLMHFIKSLI
jgi:hypothetical protein